MYRLWSNTRATHSYYTERDLIPHTTYFYHRERDIKPHATLGLLDYAEGEILHVTKYYKNRKSVKSHATHSHQKKIVKPHATHSYYELSNPTLIMKSVRHHGYITSLLLSWRLCQELSLSGPALWKVLFVDWSVKPHATHSYHKDSQTPCLCQYVRPKQSQHSGNYLNLNYLTWLSHPSPSAARLPVDEPALALRICAPLSSIRWGYRRSESFICWLKCQTPRYSLLSWR